MSDVRTSWPVVSLFDFCNPKQWPTIPQTAFVEHGYPVYGANGQIGRYTEFNHEKPTVLITCRGATCGTINVCEPKSYVTGNAMALDDLDESRVSAEYLVYALRSGSLAQAISGTAQPQITRQSLTAISIPLPPLAEQRRIAEVLDRAEALRAKRRAALAQLDTLTQSLFLDLFGDPKTNPKKWPKQKLGDLLEIEWGNTSITKESYVPEGVPAYSAAGCDGFLPQGEHEGEGIVLSAIGARCGKCFYVSGGSWTAIKNTITITPKQNSLVDLRYVFPMANDEGFWPNRGAGQPFITLGVARVQEIPVPPIPLQREFARRVSAVEKLKAAQRASQAELDALFATLQHRAFKGEL